MDLTFGEKIRESRKAKNLTQKQLADMIGAKHNSVSDWENDKNKPDPDMLELICGVLELAPNYLLGILLDDSVFSPTEKLLIEKYRTLNEHGKDIVDYVLDKEYEQCGKMEHIEQSISEQSATIIDIERSVLNPRRYLTYCQRLASAGTGEFLFDDIPTEIIKVPVNHLSERADFVIGVNGNSMEPTYHDKDKLYVEKMDEIPTGRIGIFTKGSDCLVKELGNDRLISHNKEYGDIPASDDIRCVGLVLGKVVE